MANPETNSCPHCGAFPLYQREGPLTGFRGFLMECGSHIYKGGSEWRSAECYTREIAALRTENERLRAANPVSRVIGLVMAEFIDEAKP